MTTPDNRRAAINEQRRIRYRYYLSAGFSPSEARRLRSRSPFKANTILRERQRQITRRPVARRTEQQQYQLQRIRELRRTGTVRPDLGSVPPESISSSHIDYVSRAQGDTKQARISNWRDWSRSAFPGDHLKEIQDINEAAGRPLNASFGFRVYYRKYVLGMNDQDAIDEIEQMRREGQDS